MKFIELRYTFGMSCNNIKFTSYAKAKTEWRAMLSENCDCPKYHDVEVFEWESDYKGIFQPTKSRERSSEFNKMIDDAQRDLLSRIRQIAKRKAPAGQAASDADIAAALNELNVYGFDYNELLLAEINRGEA